MWKQGRISGKLREGLQPWEVWQGTLLRMEKASFSISFHCPRAEGWDSTELRGTLGPVNLEAPLGLLS